MGLDSSSRVLKRYRMWIVLAAASIVLLYARYRYNNWYSLGTYDIAATLRYPTSLWGPKFVESPVTIMTAAEIDKSEAPHLPFVRTCIIIPTALVTKQRRMSIRKQWQRMDSGRNVSAVMRFFIGLRGLSPNQRYDAREEAERHKDVVLLENHLDFDAGGVDFSSATTHKIVEAFKWAVQNYRFDYLVRQSDDGYFNLLEFQRVTPSSLETELENRLRLRIANPTMQIPLTRTRWCRFYYHNPVREEKIKSFYRIQQYPPYCLGLGYVLTRDLVLHVAQSKVPFAVTYPEDAITGLWFGGLHITNLDDERFHHLGPQPASQYKYGKLGQQEHAPERWAEAPCRPTDLLTHYMTEHDWSLIDDDGSMTCV